MTYNPPESSAEEEPRHSSNILDHIDLLNFLLVAALLAELLLGIYNYGCSMAPNCI